MGSGMRSWGRKGKFLEEYCAPPGGPWDGAFIDAKGSRTGGKQSALPRSSGESLGAVQRGLPAGRLDGDAVGPDVGPDVSQRGGLPDGPSEAQWDGASVEVLVRAHQRPLGSYLRYLGAPSGAVDDLVQETFLTFLSSRFEERHDAATARYLRAIARHLFLKSLRRSDRDPPEVNLERAEALWVKLEEEGA